MSPVFFTLRKEETNKIHKMWQAEGERPELCIVAMGSRVPAREDASKHRPNFHEIIHINNIGIIVSI